MYEVPYSPPSYAAYGANAGTQERPDGILQRLLRRDTKSRKTSTVSESFWGYGAQQPKNRRANSTTDYYSSVEDVTHTPGNAIHALAVSSSIVALSVVAAVPKSRRFSPTAAEGDGRHGLLGEPVSLDDVRDPAKRMEMEAQAAGELCSFAFAVHAFNQFSWPPPTCC